MEKDRLLRQRRRDPPHITHVLSKGAARHHVGSLQELDPDFPAYVLSFVYVGIYWKTIHCCTATSM